jgi:hypothetical protein
MLHVAPRGLKLAPGMAPATCSNRSIYLAELELRYGIEP